MNANRLSLDPLASITQPRATDCAGDEDAIPDMRGAKSMAKVQLSSAPFWCIHLPA